MIWMVFAGMVTLAVAALLLPLWRGKPAAAGRLDYDLAVYKDQLAELDRDLERGVLTKDQAEAARIEVSRRMLAAAEADANPAGAPAARMGAAVFIAVLVPAIALGLYARLGQPQLPDQPYASRAAKIRDMQGQMAMVKAMVEQLAARLEKDPSDGKGWAMLARSLRVMGQPEKAKDAYRKALSRLPDDVKVRLEYGGLLLDEAQPGGALPPEFVAVMREVLRLDQGNGDALYFLGLAESQAGNTAKARELWTRLVNMMPADNPDRAEVVKQLDALPK